jgi:hypothetical protein
MNMNPFTLTKENWHIADYLDQLRLAYSERYMISTYWDRSWVTFHPGYTDEIQPIVSCNNGVPEYAPDPFPFDKGDPTQQGGYKVTGPRRFINKTGLVFPTGGWVLGDGTINDALQSQHLSDPLKRVTAQDYRFWYDIQLFCACFGGGFGDSINKQGFQNVWYMPLINFGFVGGGCYRDSNNYGFRRASEVSEDGEPIIEYGTVRPGDIMGAWLVEDPISCFNKMTGLTGLLYWYYGLAGGSATPIEPYVNNLYNVRFTINTSVAGFAVSGGYCIMPEYWPDDIGHSHPTGYADGEIVFFESGVEHTVRVWTGSVTPTDTLLYYRPWMLSVNFTNGPIPPTP